MARNVRRIPSPAMAEGDSSVTVPNVAQPLVAFAADLVKGWIREVMAESWQGPAPRAAMTTEDVLELFAISEHTLSRWRQEEDFPAPRKLGALNRYSRAEVDAWWLSRPKVVLHRRVKPSRFEMRRRGGVATA